MVEVSNHSVQAAPSPSNKDPFKTVYLHFKELELGKIPVKTLRFVCISDTHERELELESSIPNGDVLIHTGDFTASTSAVEQVKNFNTFLGKIKSKFKYIVCISGNHDYALDKKFYKTLTPEMSAAKNLGSFYLTNATHYLEHEQCTIEGIKIFGTPFGNYHKMAFGLSSGERRVQFSKIPADIDILLTHVPMYSILDLAYDSRAKGGVVCETCKIKHLMRAHWGCEYLKQEVVSRIQPRVHVHGHVHDHYGHEVINQTVVINAASDWRPIRKPVVFDYHLFEEEKDQKNVKKQNCMQS